MCWGSKGRVVAHIMAGHVLEFYRLEVNGTRKSRNSDFYFVSASACPRHSFFHFLSAKMAEQRIKEELAKLTTVDHIRPNKLRKIVCKKDGGMNWTEFQETLDKLIDHNEVQTEKQNGEVVILVSNTGDGASPAEVKDCSKQELQKQRKEITMEIPLAVAQHLTRKGRRKQKNIEETCKSKLVISGVDNANSPTDNVTLQIINEYGAGDDSTEEESEQSAIKQLKAAKVCIGNMISSFREHPDRYTVKKAGGTLAEQEKAKKIRERGAKLRAEKHRQKRGSAAKGYGDATPAKKKKKRKYY